MTTPYALNERDALEALLPRRGPCGLVPGAPCRIGVHHVRKRKTGPPWGWVAVATCATHGLSFTVYPPGHVPYGRVPFVDLAPDGTEKRAAKREPETLFAAAAGAATGKRWPADTATPPESVRSTQRRRVKRAAQLLGLVGERPGAALAAGVAHVPGGLLAEAARLLAASVDLARWGQEVTRVVGDLAVRSGRALMDRLAVLGHLAGLWGRPFRWAPRAGRLLALGRPFWVSRTGRPKAREPSYEFGPRPHR